MLRFVRTNNDFSDTLRKCHFKNKPVPRPQTLTGPKHLRAGRRKGQQAPQIWANRTGVVHQKIGLAEFPVPIIRLMHPGIVKEDNPRPDLYKCRTPGPQWITVSRAPVTVLCN